MSPTVGKSEMRGEVCFPLRDDVFWSDGVPVTAHDFAFAWQHTRFPDTASGEPLYDVRAVVCSTMALPPI